MTTYRLPDGIEAETTEHGLVHVGLGHWLRHPSLGTIWVGADRLTEVKPPPPEPDPLTVVIDRHGMAWQREAGTGSPDWLSLGDHMTWQALNAERGPLTRLIPDPADDAPALPWTLDSCRRSASVGTPKHGTVVVDVPGIDYTPGELEQIARALLAAARAAREVETP